MGLMIFGQKFDLGDCFIVLSNCRKSENGYYGAIFSYQLSYNNNYVALRSCNMLQMKSVPNFVNEPNPIIIPTIRPFFNEALNGLYTYYTNWAHIFLRLMHFFVRQLFLIWKISDCGVQ